jgi:hypothetical protein
VEEEDFDVLGEPQTEAAAVSDEKSGEKQTTKPAEAKAERAEIERLTRELQETKASEQFWAERARKSQPSAEDEEGETPVKRRAKAEPEDDEDEISPEKLVDELSTKGLKALRDRGFVTKKEMAAEMRRVATEVAEKAADRRVTQERGKMTADAEIAREFPELQDAGSELFKRTSEIFRAEVQADPTLAKSPGALRMAARQAKSELNATERKRVERVAAQSGDRGRSISVGFEDDNPLDISRDDEDYIKRMGIKPEAFLASKKALGNQRGSARR